MHEKKKLGVKSTYWTANSRVGVRIRTLIAGTRFGRNNNLSKVGSVKAAVCEMEQLQKTITSN